MRSSGIPAFDAAVKEIMKLPKRANHLVEPLETSLLGRIIEGRIKSDLIVVGAGWELAFRAAGFVAAGARIIAYEMNPAKFGRGQIGRTLEDDVFSYGNATDLSHLMPDFTPEQIERLPNEFRDIINLPCYQQLKKKRLSIISKGRNAYKDLPVAERISKKEVIDTVHSILDYLKKAKLLEVKYQEVTSEMVASWLNENKPVYLMTGNQVNLENLGMGHLAENPKFLKEFLLKTDETEQFIKAISDRQRVHAMSRDPSKNLPRLGIVGGGARAKICELDLCERLQDNLEVISIIPEKRLKLESSLDFVQKSMRHQFIPGYVSRLLLCDKKKTIKSVEITGFPRDEVQQIRPGLYFHVPNVELIPSQGSKWGPPFRDAMASITKLLDEKCPDNGLVRNRGILACEDADIMLRITEPLKISLADDKVLVEKIKALAKQDPKEAVIIATGDVLINGLLLWLTASLGYRGQFIQVVMPVQDHQDVELSEKLESKTKFKHRQVPGRLKNVTVNGEKFILEIHDSDGKPMSNVPDVDFLLNAAGKTYRTHLIDGLIEKGYLQEAEGNNTISYYSTHPMLSGYELLFHHLPTERNINSAGFSWYPYYPKPQPDYRLTPRTFMLGFDAARQILGKA